MKREALPPVSAFPARRRRASLRRLRRPTGCSQVGPCELRSRRSRPPASCHGPPTRRVEDRFPAPPMLGGIDLKCSFLSGCQRRQWFARKTTGAHLCRGIRLLFPLRDQAPEFHSVALRQARLRVAVSTAARRFHSGELRGLLLGTGYHAALPRQPAKLGGPLMAACHVSSMTKPNGAALRATIATCMVSADELSDTS